jgi:hypothetical protein
MGRSVESHPLDDDQGNSRKHAAPWPSPMGRE